jgi:uroporphyrinogen decarboxylase
VRPILKYYPEAGVNLANFDYCVSPGEATGELPRMCFDGNVKPLMFIEGTPMEIEAEARTLIPSFQDRGGFILSSGCEIPPESAPENIMAMVEAARTEGRHR